MGARRYTGGRAHRAQHAQEAVVGTIVEARLVDAVGLVHAEAQQTPIATELGEQPLKLAAAAQLLWRGHDHHRGWGVLRRAKLRPSVEDGRRRVRAVEVRVGLAQAADELVVPRWLASVLRAVVITLPVPAQGVCEIDEVDLAAGTLHHLRRLGRGVQAVLLLARERHEGRKDHQHRPRLDGGAGPPWRELWTHQQRPNQCIGLALARLPRDEHVDPLEHRAGSLHLELVGPLAIEVFLTTPRQRRERAA